MWRGARAPYARQGLDSVCEWQWGWPGLGRCLLMKWLRACISNSPPATASASASTSAFYSNSMNIWRGAKRQRTGERNQNEMKPNKMKLLPRRHLALQKIFFHWKHLQAQKLFKFSNRHTCVCSGWGRVGRQRSRGGGGNQKKNHTESSAPSTTSTSATPPTPTASSSSFALLPALLLGLSSFFGHATQLQMILPTPMLTQRHQVQWSASCRRKARRGRSRRSRRRKKYGSRNVNEVHCECHCSLRLVDPLLFQRI